MSTSSPRGDSPEHPPRYEMIDGSTCPVHSSRIIAKPLPVQNRPTTSSPRNNAATVGLPPLPDYVTMQPNLHFDPEADLARRANEAARRRPRMDEAELVAVGFSFGWPMVTWLIVCRTTMWDVGPGREGFCHAPLPLLIGVYGCLPLFSLLCSCLVCWKFWKSKGPRGVREYKKIRWVFVVLNIATAAALALGYGIPCHGWRRSGQK